MFCSAPLFARIQIKRDFPESCAFSARPGWMPGLECSVSRIGLTTRAERVAFAERCDAFVMPWRMCTDAADSKDPYCAQGICGVLLCFCHSCFVVGCSPHFFMKLWLFDGFSYWYGWAFSDASMELTFQENWKCFRQNSAVSHRFEPKPWQKSKICPWKELIRWALRDQLPKHVGCLLWQGRPEFGGTTRK